MTESTTSSDPSGFGQLVYAGSDLNGVMRGKRVPGDVAAGDPERGVQLSDCVFGLDLAEQIIAAPADYEGYWPFGAGGFYDIAFRPDFSTLRRVPWLADTGLVLCDIEHEDGREYPYSPRQALRRVLERARNLGLEVRVGSELEVVVLNESPASLRESGFSEPQPLRATPQVYAVGTGDREASLLDRWRRELDEFGIPIENVVVESGAGQYELPIAHREALAAADAAALLKFGMKEIAQREGLIVSAMARPPATELGNSLHLHLSLWKDGVNVVGDPAGRFSLSRLGGHALGGMLASFDEMALLFAPLENSYKRYLPDTGAGISRAWSDNWTTALRVVGQGTGACRIEHRAPGGDANPYLAIGAVVAGALHGIENELDHGEPISGDAQKMELPRMPMGLREATASFRHSALAREMFGDEFVDFYCVTRDWEADASLKEATSWEAARYLEPL